MRTADRRGLNRPSCPSHTARIALAGLVMSLALTVGLTGCGLAADSATEAATDYLGEKADEARTLQCYAQQRVIFGGLQQYKAMTNASPVSIDDLVSENILPSIPECPSGGTYTCDLENATVTCSEHGSAADAE